MDPITLALLVVLAAIIVIAAVPKWRRKLLAPRPRTGQRLRNRINGYEMLLLVTGAGGIAGGCLLALISGQRASADRALMQTLDPGYAASDPGAADLVWMWIGIALAVFGLILLVILVSIRAAKRG